MKISQKNFSTFLAGKLDEAASTKTKKNQIIKESSDSYPPELSKIPDSLSNACKTARVMIAGYASMIKDAVANKSGTKVEVRDGESLSFGWNNMGETIVTTELTFYVPLGTHTAQEIESYIPPKIAKIINFRNPNVNGNYVFSVSFKASIYRK